jgi:hypothetical protein
VCAQEMYKTVVYVDCDEALEEVKSSVLQRVAAQPDDAMDAAQPDPHTTRSHDATSEGDKETEETENSDASSSSPASPLKHDGRRRSAQAKATEIRTLHVAATSVSAALKENIAPPSDLTHTNQPCEPPGMPFQSSKVIEVATRPPVAAIVPKKRVTKKQQAPAKRTVVKGPLAGSKQKMAKKTLDIDWDSSASESESEADECDDVY